MSGQTSLDGMPEPARYTGQPYPGSVPISAFTKAVVNPGDGLLAWANRLGLAGTTLQEHRAQAQGRGTDAHANVGHLARGETPPRPSERDQAILKWLTEHQPDFAHLELRVAHRRGFHGRVDYVRRSTDCDGLIVGDFKSSGPYADQHLQVRAGAMALEDEGASVCAAELVVFRDHGSYTVYPCAADDIDVRAALRLWRLIQAVRQH